MLIVKKNILNNKICEHFLQNYVPKTKDREFSNYKYKLCFDSIKQALKSDFRKYPDKRKYYFSKFLNDRKQL